VSRAVAPTVVLSVVGARPNFMKMAPLLRAMDDDPAFRSRLVHTGQHYDDAMSAVFLRQLGMPQPDFSLQVGSGSHAVQTAETMKRFEAVCLEVDPDLVVVAGDVNSTLACALTAAKLEIPVAHVESGLRSFDRSMPEEINRIVTDSVADLLFTTEESANRNLRREGVAEEKIRYVGNTMIDSLVRFRDALDGGATAPGPDAPPYFLATVHRPANVDTPEALTNILGILEAASDLAPVLFVTHPRTLARLRQLDPAPRLVETAAPVRDPRPGSIYVLPPTPYLEFLGLMAHSTAVLTDSGGVQEETTFLGIPCLTLRPNTERPSTVELGTNELVGLDRDRIAAALCDIVRGAWKTASVPPLWDGRAAERAVAALRATFANGVG
jgi:UDP-N-acetylglucosamine 2-epimerase (non-hydrolysing)